MRPHATESCIGNHPENENNAKTNFYTLWIK